MKLALIVLAGLVGCSSGAITGPSQTEATDSGRPTSPSTTETPAPDAAPIEDDTTPVVVEDAPPPAQELVEAKDLAIKELAVFQGVKVTLEKDGVKPATTRAPVIAGREGLLRVYVAPTAAFVSREIVAELTLEGATPKVVSAKKIVSAA